MNVRRYPRPALAVALSVLACLGWTLWLIFGWGGNGAVFVVDSVGLAAFAIYATVCSALAARSAHGSSRAAWTTMSVALAALAVAELTGAFYSLVLHRDSVSRHQQTRFTGHFPLLAVAAILQLPAGLTARSADTPVLRLSRRRRGSVRAFVGHRRGNLVPADAS